jgi:hypothetical protein
VPAKTTDSAALARKLDAFINQRLQDEKITPSPRSEDAEFIRRVSLDLTGKIPTAERVVTFLDDKDPKKRLRLIDELLASPEYGKHQADVWQALLLPRNSDNRAVNRDPMVTWLAENFNANKPWDILVRDILTAEGKQDANPAVNYFLTHSTVDKMTDSTTRLFLGLRLQCAQCHNHPFTDWKQNDYWHMAAFFRKVQVDAVRANAQQAATTPGIREAGNGGGRRGARPEGAKDLPPKFLQAEQPKVNPSEPLRPVLANWITDASNPYFSKAMVNRTWSQLMGRGLVAPIDDMNEANPPSHPEMLDEMAHYFSSSGYDLKNLIRAICSTEAYQRSSKPTADNTKSGTELYAHVNIKMLSPGQLFDAIGQIVGQPRDAVAGPGRPGIPGRGGAGNPRAAFIAFFSVEEMDATEYQAGIPQVLRLMNGPQMNNSAVVNKIIKDSPKPTQAIEKLYLSVLSRRPSQAEQQRLSAYIAKQTDAKAGYADILWALLNSSEFAMNH